MRVIFFKEQGYKDWIVIAKEEDKPFKLLPYSIWYCEDNRCYVAVKVKNNPTVDTVLESEPHEESSEAFATLKEAKNYLTNRALIANGKDWKEGFSHESS